MGIYLHILESFCYFFTNAKRITTKRSFMVETDFCLSSNLDNSVALFIKCTFSFDFILIDTFQHMYKLALFQMKGYRGYS